MYLNIDGKKIIVSCLEFDLKHLIDVHPDNRMLIKAKVASAWRRSRDSNGVETIRLMTGDDRSDNDTAQELNVAWLEADCDIHQWDGVKSVPVARQGVLLLQPA